MNTQAFIGKLKRYFSNEQLFEPTEALLDKLTRDRADPCPDVFGMMSPKGQRMLGLAYASLPVGEGYLEIGSFAGKSLISALLGQPSRKSYACDDFSEWSDINSYDSFHQNLTRYRLAERVNFHRGDFKAYLADPPFEVPIGQYFYDGPHDEEHQYLAIKLAEPYLANEVLVIVDDWRHAPDSPSFAEAGTKRAIAESAQQWEMLLELPARHNCDLAMWWNGMGLYAFRRQG